MTPDPLEFGKVVGTVNIAGRNTRSIIIKPMSCRKETLFGLFLGLTVGSAICYLNPKFPDNTITFVINADFIFRKLVIASEKLLIKAWNNTEELFGKKYESLTANVTNTSHYKGSKLDPTKSMKRRKFNKKLLSPRPSVKRNKIRYKIKKLKMNRKRSSK